MNNATPNRKAAKADPRTRIIDFLTAAGPKTAEEIRAGIKSKAEIEFLVAFLRVMVETGQLGRVAAWPATPIYKVAA